MADITIEQMCEELGEMAQYEGTETGEYWSSLSELVKDSYLMSEDFRNAFEAEVREQYFWYKRNFKLEVHECTRKHIMKELVFKE